MWHKHGRGLALGLLVILFLGISLYFLSKSEAEETAPPPAVPAAEAPATPSAAVPPAAEKPADSLLAAPAALNIDIEAAVKDRVMGQASAPVTIVEYASMTCPHCAHFEINTLPELKKRLIDTGKVKFIFRDFPLDNYALRAAMMTRCLPEDKYLNMVDVVFSNQERWARGKGDPLEALAQLAALAGMDADAFKTCTQNAELETALLRRLSEARDKYKINSTPTFIFNDGAETLSGAMEISKFEEIVNKLTKGK